MGSFVVTDFLYLIAIILLLVSSAFFSSSEIVFSSCNEVRIKNYAEDNKKGARKALYILENFDKSLCAILVGNNFVNILSTTLCASFFVKVILNPVLYNIINTVVMTIIILIFGEILPKSFGKLNPEATALRLAPILYVVTKITYPFWLPFYALQKVFKKKKTIDVSPSVTEEELDSIVETMEDEGVLDEKNADIIHGALKVKDVEVVDVMTPRVDMVCVDTLVSKEQLINLFLEYHYSRLPVYSKSVDNVIGIINQKDFFPVVCGKKEFNIKDIISPAIFVSKQTKVNDVFSIMQKENKHMAIVIDEFGGTSGLVTMEDCYEQVFGEVYDEHDERNENFIVKINEGDYKINPNISVEELFDYLAIEHLPEKKNCSLATFLCYIDKRVPEQNAKIIYETIDEILGEDCRFLSKQIRLEFTLTKVEKRRIKEVELKVSYE